MGVTSFQALCDEFTDATHVERQQVPLDSEGAMTFSMVIDDVTVNVVHTHATHPDSAFLLIDFGPPPEDVEGEAEALRTLLLVNFTFLGNESATAFSIHPVYGNVTLQANWSFRDRGGEQLLRTIRLLVASAVQWRETHFLHASPAHAPARWEDLGPALRA